MPKMTSLDKSRAISACTSLGRLFSYWCSWSCLGNPQGRSLVLRRGTGTEGLPALGNKILFETRPADTGDIGLRLLMPWLVSALGVMASLRLLSVPQDLLCSSKGLWLCGEWPELCSTLCWALLWGQPNWAALLDCVWGSGDGESWRGARLGWKVSAKHQCRTCTA